VRGTAFSPKTSKTNSNILYACGPPWPTTHIHSSWPQVLWGLIYVTHLTSCHLPAITAWWGTKLPLCLFYIICQYQCHHHGFHLGLLLSERINVFQLYCSWAYLATLIILWPSRLWHCAVLHGKVTIYCTSVTKSQRWSIVCARGKMLNISNTFFLKCSQI